MKNSITENQLDDELSAYRKKAIEVIFICATACSVLGGGLFFHLVELRPAILILLFFCGLGYYWTKRGVLNNAVVVLGFILIGVPIYFSINGLGIYDSTMMVIPAGMFAMALVAMSPKMVWLYCISAVMGASVVFEFTVMGYSGGELSQGHERRVVLDGLQQLSVLVFTMVISALVSQLLHSLFEKVKEGRSQLTEQVRNRTVELLKANEDLSDSLEKLSRAKEEMVKSAKLASLGSLVAGVAHELNTPIGNAKLALTTLTNKVEKIRNAAESGNVSKSGLAKFLQDSAELADLALSANDRAAGLISSFKRVAVDQSAEWKREFLVQDLISDIIKTMMPTYKNTPWLIEQGSIGVVSMNSFPGPMGQVVANLIENAMVHGFEGVEAGLVKITVERSTEIDWVNLIVVDNGLGISPENMDRIFDPFFSTKIGQGGSGLGLTVCFNLVEEVLGGKIYVESKLGAGAKFIVHLPINAPEQLRGR